MGFKDCWDLVEYNDYMRVGFQKVADEINYFFCKGNPNRIMTYRVGDEFQLIGILKMDPDVEIEFYMKEADI